MIDIEIYVYFFLTNAIHRCRELGLLDRCISLEAKPADESEIITVHTQELLEILKNTQGSEDVDKLENISSSYDAIYIHPVRIQLLLFLCHIQPLGRHRICKLNKFLFLRRIDYVY
jgi:hypothetical protein